MEKKYAIFHDTITGETIERELTNEEIDALPEPIDLSVPE